MSHHAAIAYLANPAIAGAILLADAAAAISLSKSDITGPHALVLCSIFAIVVLWGAIVAKEKKEDKRRADEDAARERRHEETIAIQKDMQDKLLGIVSLQAALQEKTVGAIRWLASELSERPCRLHSKLKSGDEFVVPQDMEGLK